MFVFLIDNQDYIVYFSKLINFVKFSKNSYKKQCVHEP